MKLGVRLSKKGGSFTAKTNNIQQVRNCPAKPTTPRQLRLVVYQFIPLVPKVLAPSQNGGCHQRHITPPPKASADLQLSPETPEDLKPCEIRRIPQDLEDLRAPPCWASRNLEAKNSHQTAISFETSSNKKNRKIHRFKNGWGPPYYK